MDKETIIYLDGFTDGLNMANNSTNKILDKIRAEIETKYGQCILCEIDSGYDRVYTITEIGDIAEILHIIDKYKAETEEV